MDYKTKFKPLERLGRDGWRRMDEPEGGAATGPVELPLRRSRRRLHVDS
jgi:arginine-tRNA-protein transferase